MSNWTIGETPSGLAFRKDGSPKFFIENTGKAWSGNAEGGDLRSGSLSYFDPGDSNGYAKTVGKNWLIAETPQGLVFKRNGIVKLLIKNDGDVWESYSSAYLQGTGTVSPDTSPNRAHTAIEIGGSWKIAENTNGHLVFRKNDDVKLLVKDNSEIWGKHVAGFFDTLFDPLGSPTLYAEPDIEDLVVKLEPFPAEDFTSEGIAQYLIDYSEAATNDAKAAIEIPSFKETTVPLLEGPNRGLIIGVGVLVGLLSCLPGAWALTAVGFGTVTAIGFAALPEKTPWGAVKDKVIALLTAVDIRDLEVNRDSLERSLKDYFIDVKDAFGNLVNYKNIIVTSEVYDTITNSVKADIDTAKDKLEDLEKELETFGDDIFKKNITKASVLHYFHVYLAFHFNTIVEMRRYSNLDQRVAPSLVYLYTESHKYFKAVIEEMLEEERSRYTVGISQAYGGAKIGSFVRRDEELFINHIGANVDENAILGKCKAQACRVLLDKFEKDNFFYQIFNGLLQIRQEVIQDSSEQAKVNELQPIFRSTFNTKAGASDLTSQDYLSRPNFKGATMQFYYNIDQSIILGMTLQDLESKIPIPFQLQLQRIIMNEEGGTFPPRPLEVYDFLQLDSELLARYIPECLIDRTIYGYRNAEIICNYSLSSDPDSQYIALYEGNVRNYADRNEDLTRTNCSDISPGQRTGTVRFQRENFEQGKTYTVALFVRLTSSEAELADYHEILCDGI